MVQAGEKVTIKLPSGMTEVVTIIQTGGTSVTIQYQDGGRDVLHVSHLTMLTAAASR